MRSRTWKGPSPRWSNLERLCAGNLDANLIDLLWDPTTILELLLSVANPNQLSLRPNNNKLNIFTRKQNLDLSLIVNILSNAYKETQTTVIPIVNLWPNVYKETQIKGIQFVFWNTTKKEFLKKFWKFNEEPFKGANARFAKILLIYDHKMLLQWVVGSIHRQGWNKFT